MERSQDQSQVDYLLYCQNHLMLAVRHLQNLGPEFQRFQPILLGKDICPVVEFGTTGFTPHMVNECVKLEDLELLAKCYREILEGYFA